MFVDALIIFVIIAERILRLISLSESLETKSAQLEGAGRSLGSAVGPPHPAWARQGQSSASAPRAGLVAPRKSSGLWVSTSFGPFLLRLWP